MSLGSSVPRALKVALDAIDYLPNAVAAWEDAHGGNKALAEANAKKVREAQELLGRVLASLPAGKQYVVYGVEGWVGSVDTVDALVKALAELGIKRTGTQDNARLRPELVGAPTFDKLVGPMYGGPGLVRYETQEAYDRSTR